MEEKRNAMYIVDSIKDYTKQVDHMNMLMELDFIGCSEDYCKEKIDYLIFKLKTLKGHLKLLNTNK